MVVGNGWRGCDAWRSSVGARLEADNMHGVARGWHQIRGLAAGEHLTEYGAVIHAMAGTSAGTAGKRISVVLDKVVEGNATKTNAFCAERLRL